MASIPCTNCGQKISIPEDHSRPKIRCTLCGYYAVVPSDLRATSDDIESTTSSEATVGGATTQKVKAKVKTKENDKSVDDPHARRARPNNNPDDHRPNFESLDPVGPNLLDGDDIERDDVESTTPYAVPGTGTKKCSECRGELPLDATLCVHCGIEIVSKSKKAKRRFTPLYREWEPYASFDLRMKVFIGMQILNLLFFVLTIALSWGAPTGLTFIVMQTGLQAFLLGTFDKIVLTRTDTGKAELVKHWRLGFFTFKKEPINWKASHGTAIVATHNPGFLEWYMMVYLLFCGIIPGILFYWYIIKPERYEVVLCDVHGSTDQTIFRTSNRDTTDEICKMISEVTTLDYRRVV